jgi:hypothetical protein
MQTLLGKSKTRGKAFLDSAFDGQSDRGYLSGEAHTHGIGNQLLRFNQHSQDIKPSWISDARLFVGTFFNMGFEMAS